MIDELLRVRSPWRDKLQLWVAVVMDFIENIFNACIRLFISMPSVYYQRFITLTLMEMLLSDYAIFFIFKFLQIQYNVDNFLLIFSFGWIIPFIATNGRVLKNLDCPRTPMGLAQLFVWGALILLSILTQFTYNNVYVTIIFVAASWPPLLLFLTMSAMHLNTRFRVQFAATWDFPLLGILGVMGHTFSIVGLKGLSFLDVLTMLALDGLWAAIFSSIILGIERQKLHKQFIKSVRF